MRCLAVHGVIGRWRPLLKSAFQNRVILWETLVMRKPLLPDDVWAIVEPVLSAERPKPTGGQPRVPNRAELTGIIFVRKAGIPWEYLPQELGCGSGVTCWRCLRDGQDASEDTCICAPLSV